MEGDFSFPFFLVSVKCNNKLVLGGAVRVCSSYDGLKTCHPHTAQLMMQVTSVLL